MKEQLIIGIVGLGYVGIPLAVSFSKKYKVIGFDYNKNKIEQYKNGIDVTNEVGDDEIKASSIDFTSDESKLKECDRIIVAVPTPVDENYNPDLYPLQSASEIVGKNLKKDTIVIYESTVYPGLTEEVCMPILEKESNMICGRDFKIAYSPERVNPGDKVHRFENIKKIVSGMDEETLEEVAKLYSSVLKNGVFKAASIKVAEAAKVIENSQRDVNIAFANEIAMMCDTLKIDTNDVLDAACTKWNFLNFRPGLVGGHCIGVDPYYLIQKTKDLGYNSKLLSSARSVNESISNFIVDKLISKLSSKNIDKNKAIVKVLGVTFKENVKDTRNSKVIDIIKGLQRNNIKVIVQDPNVSIEEIEKEYNITLEKDNHNQKVDAVIIAVADNEYKELTKEELLSMLNETKIVFDIKNILNKEELEKVGIDYWRL